MKRLHETPTALNDDKWRSYAFAFVVITAAIAFTLLYRQLIWPIRFSALLTAVCLAAIRGGVGPALFATTIGAASAVLVILAPHGTFHIEDRFDIGRLALFVVFSALMIWAVALRRRAEAQRDAARHWLHTTLASLGEAVVATDLNQAIVFANPASEKLLRRSRDDLMGKRLDEAITVVDSSGNKVIVHQSGFRADDLHLRRHDGKTIAVDLTAAPILAGGHSDGTVFVFRDATERQVTQQKLRESERLLRSVADSVPVLIWMASEDGNRYFFNRTYLEFTGRSIEQELGDGWMSHIHPEDRDAIVERYRSAFTTKERFEYEYRLRRRDGVYRRVLVEAVPRYSTAGVFVGFIGSAMDITDRYALEQERAALMREVAHERDRLGDILASLPGIVWEASGAPAPGREILFINDQAEKLLGYSREEWRSSPDLGVRIVHPEDRARMTEDFEAWMRGESDAPIQARCFTKDGRIVWLETHAAVMRDEKGTAVGIRGVTFDVTARRKAEESLRLLERVSAVVSASLDAEKILTDVADLVAETMCDISIVDVLMDDEVPNRVAVAARDSKVAELAAELRSYPPRRGGSIPIVDLNVEKRPIVVDNVALEEIALHGIDERHREIIRQLNVRSSMAVPLVARSSLLGGITFLSRLPDAFDASDLQLADLVARRIAVAFDNSLLYRDALQANRAKDEFLATVSHELRTPMTAIQGWATMLRRGAIDAETETLALETIERSARAQAKIIEDILDVSRIITGKFHLDLRPVSIPIVLSAATSGLLPAAEAKGITLRLHDETGGAQVSGDAARLQQVLWNLVSNAIKFTEHGGTIDVEVRRSGTMIQITVRDNGVGIDPSFVPYVFERFRQADASTTRRHGGLGLGLAVVRHIVELHGGRVSCSSEGLGKGATFTIELPLLREGQWGEQTLTKGRVIGTRLSGVSVLVVDDDEMSRRMIASILEHQGATAVTASTAAEGIAALTDRTFDLIVSDIAMPETDGFTFIREATALIAPRGVIPAIAVSAHGGADAEKQIRNAGYRSFVRKPFDPAELVAAAVGALPQDG